MDLGWNGLASAATVTKQRIVRKRIEKNSFLLYDDDDPSRPCFSFLDRRRSSFVPVLFMLASIGNEIVFVASNFKTELEGYTDDIIFFN